VWYGGRGCWQAALALPCPHLFVMQATRCAKRQVQMLSSACRASGATAATMTVRQLPPSESRRASVSMELR
jgi:hypothetical protein